MKKINKEDFLVLKVDNNDLLSLYFPDVAKKIKPFSLANQEYYDLLVQKCQTTNRTILYYQENNQTPNAITKYFSEMQNKFSNIKDYFLINKYFKWAQKDNLCRALGINDHGLKQDWALFTKINGTFCYCDNNDDKGICVLYALTDQYYFTVSRVNSYLNLERVLNLPHLVITATEVFTLDLPWHDLDFKSQKDFAKDDGQIFEDMIAAKLNAVNVKDLKFCVNNKKKLIKLGSFTYPPVPVADKEYLAAVKKVADKMKSKINKLITLLKKKIFQNQEIKTQELVVNETLKIFGYADFTNEHAVLEMKFVQNYHKVDDINKVNDYLKRYQYQLYITAKNRPVYLLIGSYEKFSLFKINFQDIKS